MNDVVVSGVDDNASIGSITGAGSKTAEYEFTGKNTSYDLTGKLTITNGTIYIDEDVVVQAAGQECTNTCIMRRNRRRSKAGRKICHEDR